MADPGRSYMDVKYFTIGVVCPIGLGFGWAKWADLAQSHSGGSEMVIFRHFSTVPGWVSTVVSYPIPNLKLKHT